MWEEEGKNAGCGRFFFSSIFTFPVSYPLSTPRLCIHSIGSQVLDTYIYFIKDEDENRPKEEEERLKRDGERGQRGEKYAERSSTLC